MLFNSYEFLLMFLPICVLAWWGLANRTQSRLLMLIAGSYLFYGWWNWEFTALLAFSTLLDFFVGNAIYRATSKRRKQLFLAVSIVTNLGILFYFKYIGFFSEAINDVLSALRVGEALPVMKIMLPVGISFYTFQTLSYSIDLYQGKVKPSKSLLHFTAYVSMFPQLIAGPIVRYRDVEEQLDELPRDLNWDFIANGIWFFVLGLSQKLLIADTIAKSVNPLLQDCSQLQFIAGWTALVGYACQLYFDFSGYSNMAVGLGWMLGLRFPKNFDSPYKATSVQDFWRRWHITLSTFLRDYVYIPLGGNRSGDFFTYRNLLLVMLIGGVWHGAGWTFLLWGMLHGMLLVVNTLWTKYVPFRLPVTIAWSATFLSVLIGWLFFRSVDLAMAGDWLQAIVGLQGIEPNFAIDLIKQPTTLMIPVALSICLFAPNTWDIKPRYNWPTLAFLAVLYFVCVLRIDSESPFLYFQF